MKVRMLPIVVDAFQWKGRESFVNLCKELDLAYDNTHLYVCNDNTLIVTAPYGHYKIDVGDWVVKGKNNILYPYADSFFKETYEIIDKE